jgi:hypothetical protein
VVGRFRNSKFKIESEVVWLLVRYQGKSEGTHLNRQSQSSAYQESGLRLIERVSTNRSITTESLDSKGIEQWL